MTQERLKRDILAAAIADRSLKSPTAAAKATGDTPSHVSRAGRNDPEWWGKLQAVLERNRSGQTEEFPSFPEFRQRFFGYYLAEDAGAAGEDVVRATNVFFHTEGYKQIEENKRLIMLVPPGHMKTSIWSIEYSAYRIMRDRKVRITIIQKSEGEAKKIVRAVQERLTSHEFYQGLGIPFEEDPITLYGGPKGFKPERYSAGGKSWGADHFTVVDTGLRGEKDYTFQAKGATSSILSVRSELIILDDIQDIRTMSPQNTEDLMDWLNSAIITRLGPHSKLVVLGSRLGPADIYGRLMADKPQWPVVRFPAVLDWDTHEVLLPDVWPWDALMERKAEVGSAWDTSYMMEEGDSSASVFSREAMEEARSPDHALGAIPPEVTDVFIGMDPAIQNWNVIVVWGLNRKTGVRYLIDVIRRKGLKTWDNVVNLLSDAALRYNPRVVVIETNNTQGHVYETARKRLGQMGIRVKDYKTRGGSGEQAHDQEFSISSVAALFDDDLVVLPGGGDAKIVEDYIKELSYWHTAEDGTSVKYLVRDQVMATLFAESEARVWARKAWLDKQPAERNWVPSWVKGSRAFGLRQGTKGSEPVTVPRTLQETALDRTFPLEVQTSKGA